MQSGLIIGLGVLVLVILLSYSLIPTEILRSVNFFKIKRKNGGRKIYLTFDDGPSSGYTPELLDLLKERGINATFFVVAEFAEENPDIIARMKREGHQIALHTLNHRCLMLEGPISTERDLNKAFGIMKDLDADVRYFRAPWGIVNMTMLGAIRHERLKMVLWSVMAEDWRGNITSEEIARRLEKRVHNGSIICLHDGRGTNEAPSRTIKALRKMLPQWQDEGYSFMRMDQRDD